MRVECRDLVNFGERQLHFGRKRGEMRGGEMAVFVLNEMQMLDQQITPARPVAEQRDNLVERLRVDLAAFRRAARAILAAEALGADGGMGRDCGHASPWIHCKKTPSID